MHVKLFLSTSEYSRRIILLLLVSEYWVKNRSRNGRNVVYADILNIDALHSQPYKRAQTSRGAGAKRCYEGTIIDQGWGVGVVGLWVWSPLASGGRFGKNLTFFYIYIYIRINDFIMILCLFCKLFEPNITLQPN